MLGLTIIHSNLFNKMKILEFIFTNISLQTYTILATLIFTILFYFVTIFIIKFYSSDSKNVHLIARIFILLFSILAAIVAQGVIAELYIFRDWECSLKGSCIK